MYQYPSYGPPQSDNNLTFRPPPRYGRPKLSSPTYGEMPEQTMAPPPQQYGQRTLGAQSYDEQPPQNLHGSWVQPGYGGANAQYRAQQYRPGQWNQHPQYMYAQPDTRSMYANIAPSRRRRAGYGTAKTGYGNTPPPGGWVY